MLSTYLYFQLWNFNLLSILFRSTRRSLSLSLAEHNTPFNFFYLFTSLFFLLGWTAANHQDNKKWNIKKSTARFFFFVCVFFPFILDNHFIFHIFFFFEIRKIIQCLILISPIHCMIIALIRRIFLSEQTKKIICEKNRIIIFNVPSAETIWWSQISVRLICFIICAFGSCASFCHFGWMQMQIVGKNNFDTNSSFAWINMFLYSRTVQGNDACCAVRDLFYDFFLLLSSLLSLFILLVTFFTIPHQCHWKIENWWLIRLCRLHKWTRMLREYICKSSVFRFFLFYFFFFFLIFAFLCWLLNTVEKDSKSTTTTTNNP